MLYCLSCLCLCAAERRRLDGFQNRCLCKILGIQPSYYSRVSNAEILRKSGHQRATLLLQQRQLLLFGKVARTEPGHPLREASFIPGSLQAATDRYIRRKGRPRREWVPEVRKLAFAVTGGHANPCLQMQDPQIWKQTVKNYIATII